MRRALVPFAPLALGVCLLGCDTPSPQAPAEPIGEYPVWGQNFGKEESQPAGAGSLFAGEGPAPSDAPDNAATSGGGAAVAPNMKDTFSSSEWSGGDVELGRATFVNQCARCHGVEGKGGNLPGVGVVPTLADGAWHERTSDKTLASTIAHGKGAMPSFMGKLSRDELAGVIAYLRILAK